MTEEKRDAQEEAARTGDAILSFPDCRKAVAQDFERSKAVIFIHGFTAGPEYLDEFMRLFHQAGFGVFAFRYESYRGIDRAAGSLVSLMRLLDRGGVISRGKVVLIGHSMGGLVARTAVLLAGGHKYVRKVITVGTPNDGTLRGEKMPLWIARLGESIGGLNPRGFSKKAVSAQQLVKADPAPTLIERLNSMRSPSGVEYFSFSGGYTRLDFGGGFWKNFLANRYLQSKLGSPNDGLVEEASSDLSGSKFAIAAPSCLHLNNYVGYSDANHTYIVQNQEVELKAIDLSE
jgi:pimeloyl-ACP methyl ester carboxylesterase